MKLALLDDKLDSLLRTFGTTIAVRCSGVETSLILAFKTKLLVDGNLLEVDLLSTAVDDVSLWKPVFRPVVVCCFAVSFSALSLGLPRDDILPT